MKKLLLGLGTVSLAILPVVAMVSCSSETTKPQIEADKFATSQPAKNPATTTIEAVESILYASNGTQWLEAVNSLINTPLPTLSEGFEMFVLLAAVSYEDEKSIEVTFQIIETSTKQRGLAKFIITDLTYVEPTLDNQVSRFIKNGFAKPGFTTAEAAATITGTPAEKLAAANKFLTIELTPKFLLKGFTFTVDSVKTYYEGIEFVITVTDTASKETREALYRVSGFKSTLDIEASLFDSGRSSLDSSITATEAAATITGTPAEKLAAASKFYRFPSLAPGFTFTVDSAAVNGTTNTSMDITVTITGPDKETKTLTFQVLNFKATPVVK